MALNKVQLYFVDPRDAAPNVLSYRSSSLSFYLNCAEDSDP